MRQNELDREQRWLAKEAEREVQMRLSDQRVKQIEAQMKEAVDQMASERVQMQEMLKIIKIKEEQASKQLAVPEQPKPMANPMSRLTKQPSKLGSFGIIPIGSKIVVPQSIKTIEIQDVIDAP